MMWVLERRIVCDRRPSDVPNIFCAGGAARVGARRETYDDLLAREAEVY